MATGMSAETGRRITGADHLRQSVRDILTTPVGTRVMRRDYGSRVPALIDSGDLVAIQSAAAEALAVWEPRIEVTRVLARRTAPGRIEIDVEGRNLETGGEVRLEGASS